MLLVHKNPQPYLADPSPRSPRAPTNYADAGREQLPLHEEPVIIKRSQHAQKGRLSVRRVPSEHSARLAEPADGRRWSKPDWSPPGNN